MSQWEPQMPQEMAQEATLSALTVARGLARDLQGATSPPIPPSFAATALLFDALAPSVSLPLPNQPPPRLVL